MLGDLGCCMRHIPMAKDNTVLTCYMVEYVQTQTIANFCISAVYCYCCWGVAVVIINITEMFRKIPIQYIPYMSPKSLLQHTWKPFPGLGWFYIRNYLLENFSSSIKVKSYEKAKVFLNVCIWFDWIQETNII